MEIVLQKARDGEVHVMDFKDGLVQLWTNLGVLSALVMTMVQFTEKWKCDEDMVEVLVSVKTCNTVHLGLSTASLVGNFLGMMITVLLLSYISLIPETDVLEFLEEFGWASALSIKSILLGLLAWLVDEAWAGFAVHGTMFSVVCGMSLVFSLLFVLHLRHQMAVWFDARAQRQN